MHSPMHRIYLAFLCFFRILFGKALPDEVIGKQLPAAPLPEPKLLEAKVVEVAPVPVKPEKPEKPDVSPGALQLLGLLQREGRLIDFLNEGIEDFDDATVGAAVRDIHKGCRKVLQDYFSVERIVDAPENETITISDGFDAARIRLVGNVVGQPPFRGTVRHHGWRAVKVSLPVVSDGMDQSIVAPAEVELP
jgi:hypothetical protein